VADWHLSRKPGDTGFAPGTMWQVALLPLEWGW